MFRCSVCEHVKHGKRIEQVEQVERIEQAKQLNIINQELNISIMRIDKHDIEELGGACTQYLDTFKPYRLINGGDILCMHNIIYRIKERGGIDAQSIIEMAEQYNVHTTDITYTLESAYTHVEGLRNVIIRNIADMKHIDIAVGDVLKFCNEFLNTREDVLRWLFGQELLSEADIRAVQNLHCFCAGDYGGMSVEDFVTGCAIADISGSDHSAIGERVRYMMAECKDANIRRELEQWLLLHVGDAGTPATPTPAPPAVGEAHQLAEVYTEAEERPDTSTTDFLHMRSFSPTIRFDIGALYSFLIDEGVIKNISESLFTDCITHANINELWGKCIKSKMKCVLHHIKNYYEKEWFCSIYKSVGLDKSKMGKFNLGSKRSDFETKIIELIQKPQQKP